MKGAAAAVLGAERRDEVAVPGRGEVRRMIAIRDGRPSSETLRHDTADEHGNATRQAVEYAVLDRAGRVQLPREMTEALGMKDRVRLQQDPDHIGVWPDQGAGQ